MRKIRNFFICSFHLNCPTTEEQITDRQVLLGVTPKSFELLETYLSLPTKANDCHNHLKLKTNALFCYFLPF